MHFSKTALVGATLLGLCERAFAGGQAPGTSVTAHFTLFTTDGDDTASPDGVASYLGINNADFDPDTEFLTFDTTEKDNAAVWSLNATSGMLTLESGPANVTGGYGYWVPRVSGYSIGYAIVAIPADVPAYKTQYPLSCSIDDKTSQFTCQFWEGGIAQFYSCGNVLNTASPGTSAPITDLVSCASGGQSQLTLYASFVSD